MEKYVKCRKREHNRRKLEAQVVREILGLVMTRLGSDPEFPLEAHDALYVIRKAASDFEAGMNRVTAYECYKKIPNRQG